MPSTKFDINKIMGHIKRAIQRHDEITIEYDEPFGMVLVIIGDLDKIYGYYEKLIVTCMLCGKSFSKKGENKRDFINDARKAGWEIIQKGRNKGEFYCPNCR